VSPDISDPVRLLWPPPPSAALHAETGA
jgi:hypothetical protein